MVINGYPNWYTGWWLTYPSELYEFVSWDDYSQFMEEKNPNHQPVYNIYIYDTHWYLINETYIDQENYQI